MHTSSEASFPSLLVFPAPFPLSFWMSECTERSSCLSTVKEVILRAPYLWMGPLIIVRTTVARSFAHTTQYYLGLRVHLVVIVMNCISTEIAFVNGGCLISSTFGQLFSFSWSFYSSRGFYVPCLIMTLASKIVFCWQKGGWPSGASRESHHLSVLFSNTQMNTRA